MPTDFNLPIDDLMIVNMETGEKQKLGHIKEVELTAAETDGEQKYLDLMSGEKAFSCSFRIPLNLVYLAFLSVGAKNQVPNNWLKRHKYPMNRRKA